MNYEKLSKTALSAAVKVLVKTIGIYDLAQLHDMQGVIIAEFIPLFRAPEPTSNVPAGNIEFRQDAIDDLNKVTKALLNTTPEPVDDKALVEALARIGLSGWPDECQIIVNALRAARLEVAKLRKDKERLEAAIKHERSALYIYRDRQNGTASHKDITTGIELLDAALYPRAAGEGKGAT